MNKRDNFYRKAGSFRLSIILIILITFIFCNPRISVKLRKENDYPPTNEVQIFWDAQKIKQKYEIIADISGWQNYPYSIVSRAQSYSNQNNNLINQTILNDLVPVAKKYGAHGLIIQDHDVKNSYLEVKNAYGVKGYSELKLVKKISVSAIAIRIYSD